MQLSLEKQQQRELRVESEMQQMVGYLNSTGINLRNLHEWRWLNRQAVEVNGLPSCNGLAVMTDGVLAVVENEAGESFICHFESFVYSNSNSSNSKDSPSAAKAKKAKVLEEFNV